MWLHYNSAFSSSNGITYFVRSTGTVPVKCAMRELDFSSRCLVAQYCVAKVCQQANHTLSANQRDAIVRSAIRDLCKGPVSVDEHSNEDLIVTIKLDQITFVLPSSGKVVRQHAMSNILFSFTDEDDDSKYAALVVKEPELGRVCLVLDCGTQESARCIITTIGQAFHLRFQQAKEQANKPANSTVVKEDKIDMPNTSQHSTPIGSTTGGSFAFNDRTNKDELSAKISHASNSSFISPIRPMTRSVAYSNLATPVMDTAPKVELEHQPWFHGPLSRFATSLLVIEDGEFLVRASQAKRGQFVLSGMVNGDLHHILLVDKDGLVRKYDGTIFESIVDLIEHHISTQEPVVTFDGVVLLLTDPVVHKLE